MTENHLNAPTLDEEELVSRDAWSVNDLAWLLLGQTPDPERPFNAERNQAQKTIEAAIRAGALPLIPGGHTPDTLYGSQLIRPQDAIKWARGKADGWRYKKTFPRFSSIETPLKDSERLEETEVKRLQKALSALVLGLAKKGGKWASGGKPNISTIVTMAIEGVCNGLIKLEGYRRIFRVQIRVQMLTKKAVFHNTK